MLRWRPKRYDSRKRKGERRSYSIAGLASVRNHLVAAMPKIIAVGERSPIERAARWASYETWPGSGLPRRRHAIRAARAFESHGCTPDQIRDLLTRYVQSQEPEEAIENAIRLVTGTDLGERSNGGAGWPEPDVAAIEKIVAASSLMVETLRRSGKNRVAEYSQAEIVRALHHEKALVCAGFSRECSFTTPVERLISSGRLPELQFIVANPMSKRSGKTQDGKESARTAESACREENRRFLILEWDGQTKDNSVRLVTELLRTHRHCRLAMAVDSGGKSIHHWINVRDVPADRKEALMADAARLGADPRAFILSQWVRFPGGLRRGSDGAEKRQEVIYFNPDSCPQNEASPGD